VAARDYATLAKSFTESDHIKEYEFYRDFSLILADATSAIIDPDRVMDELRKFLKGHQKNPLLSKNPDKVWKVYDQVITKVLKDAEETSLTAGNLDKIDEARDKASSWLKEAKPFWPDPKEAPRSIVDRLAKLEQKVRDERYVLQFLKKVDDEPYPTLEKVDFY